MKKVSTGICIRCLKMSLSNSIKTKKGKLAVTLLMVLIIASVFAITMIRLQAKVSDVAKGKVDKGICRESVRLIAQSKTPILDLKLSELKCPTLDIKIESKDKEIVKQQLGTLLYDCWDQFGEGKLHLFDTRIGKEKYCVICHHITFKEEMKISAEEFVKYLRKEKVGEGLEEISLHDYLAGVKTDPKVLDELKNKMTMDEYKYDINTETPYATAFTYAKKGYLNKFHTPFIGTTVGMFAGLALAPFTAGGSLIVATALGVTGTVGGGVIGFISGKEKTADWDAGILLMPYDVEELKELDCTSLQ